MWKAESGRRLIVALKCLVSQPIQQRSQHGCFMLITMDADRTARFRHKGSRIASPSEPAAQAGLPAGTLPLQRFPDLAQHCFIEISRAKRMRRGQPLLG